MRRKVLEQSGAAHAGSVGPAAALLEASEGRRGSRAPPGCSAQGRNGSEAFL